ncbi:YozQ family protein [Bacillus sp. JJ1122]|uniref:YozQ family protein n=1 Tax=Bacillus sp. JJ1122 TaxID=3122951 RepID=UPI003000A425
MDMGESKNTDLAGRNYDTSDYKRNDELSNGLAVTHEQASDSYTEGEISGKIERKSGNQDAVARRGYQ